MFLNNRVKLRKSASYFVLASFLVTSLPLSSFAGSDSEDDEGLSSQGTIHTHKRKRGKELTSRARTSEERKEGSSNPQQNMKLRDLLQQSIKDLSSNRSEANIRSTWQAIRSELIKMKAIKSQLVEICASIGEMGQSQGSALKTSTSRHLQKLKEENLPKTFLSFCKALEQYASLNFSEWPAVDAHLKEPLECLNDIITGDKSKRYARKPGFSQLFARSKPFPSILDEIINGIEEYKKSKASSPSQELLSPDVLQGILETLLPLPNIGPEGSALLIPIRDGRAWPFEAEIARSLGQGFVSTSSSAVFPDAKENSLGSQDGASFLLSLPNIELGEGGQSIPPPSFIFTPIKEGVVWPSEIKIAWPLGQGFASTSSSVVVSDEKENSLGRQNETETDMNTDDDGEGLRDKGKTP